MSSPSVCIVGGGISGICAAVKLEKELGIKNYKIYEENEDFGGTWLRNTYPGCACDVRSHLYSFSFELNPNWSKSFSGQEEIWHYVIGVAQKYGLYSKAHFNMQVKKLEWTPAKNQWKVEIFNKNTKNVQTEYYDYIISAVGGLRVPLIPDIFKGFTGTKMHSAEWNKDVDFTNKKVALIGSGSSAVQILPELAGKVRSLYSYQRKPAWISPQFQYNFYPWVRKIFSWFPFIMMFLRMYIFMFQELLLYRTLKTNTVWAKYGEKMLVNFINKNVNDPETRKKLTPDYRVGCKRICLSSSYLPAFNRENVHLKTSHIVKVEGNKITTEDGETQEFDILVLATGFKIQDLFAPMEIRVDGNVSLLEKWKQTVPETYYGIMSHLVPNSFFLLGPNTGLGHNSAIYMIECQVNFSMSVLKEAIRRKAKVVRVKESAVKGWMSSIMEVMKRMVWGTERCGSWYANKDGVVTALYPLTCRDYDNGTKNIDFTNFEFK